jgi:ElaB/YqjD/DUF883 family membrane-anchored ribosome-binding protein
MKNRNGTEDLQRGMADLKNDARALVAATGDLASDAIVQARKKLAATLEATKAVQSAKAADKALRKNPYQAVGIAFGLGALFGFILARRR